MNRKTIYYIEGTKKNVISLPCSQAEKHFKMGVAIEINKMVWALPPEKCIEHAEKEVQRYLDNERGIRLDDIVTPSVLDMSSNYEKVMNTNVVPSGLGEIPKSVLKKNREIYGVSGLLETILTLKNVEEIHKLIRESLHK